MFTFIKGLTFEREVSARGMEKITLEVVLNSSTSSHLESGKNGATDNPTRFGKTKRDMPAKVYVKPHAAAHSLWTVWIKSKLAVKFL